MGSTLAVCCALGACTQGASHIPVPRRWVGADTGAVMDRVGEEYVKLVLAMGTHDPDYVDAYYGPPEWRTAAEREKPPVEVIQSRAAALVTMLGDAPPSDADSLGRLRHGYLGKQLASLDARARMLRGERLPFDEESRALYDAVAPTHDSTHFQRVLDQLEDVLPGDGPLTDRYDAFRQRFVIPPERLVPSCCQPA